MRLFKKLFNKSKTVTEHIYFIDVVDADNTDNILQEDCLMITEKIRQGTREHTHTRIELASNDVTSRSNGFLIKIVGQLC